MSVREAGPVAGARHWALLILVLLLAAALRLQGLRHLGAYWEEYVMLAGAGVFDSFKYYTAPVNLISGMYVPTIIWMFFEWSRHISASAEGIRCMNVLLGLLSIMGIYATGRRLFGPGEGLLAAALLAGSAVHVWWDQTLLPYTTPVTVGILSIYCFVGWLQTGSRYFLAAHLLLCNLFLTLHLTTNMYLVPLFLTILLRHAPNVRPAIFWAFSFLPAWLFCTWWVVPNANYFIDYNDYVAPRIGELVYHLLGQDVMDFIIEYKPALALDAHPWATAAVDATRPWANGLLALVMLGLLAGSLAIVFRSAQGQVRKLQSEAVWPWVFLLLYLFMPFICIYVLSQVARPVYANRFMQSTTCAAYLLVAATLYRIPSRRVRNLVVLLLAVLGAYQLFLLKASATRPEMYAVATYLEDRVAPQEPVYVVADNAGYGESIYRCLTGDRCRGAVQTTITHVEAAFKARQWLSESTMPLHENAWLVIENPSDPGDDEVSAAFRSYGIVAAREWFFVGKLVRLYAIHGEPPGTRPVPLPPEARPEIGFDPLKDLPNAMLVCWYGTHLMDTGRTDEAIPALTHAVTMQPGLPYSYFCLGIAQGLQGNDTKAAASFEEAFRRDYRTLTVYEPLIDGIYVHPDKAKIQAEINVLAKGWYVPKSLLVLAERHLNPPPAALAK